MPTFGLYYRIIVKDKNGKVKRRTRWRKSKSLTIGFLKHLQFLMIHAYSGGAQSVSITDIGNTARNFGAAGQYISEELASSGPDNDGTYGIVLGIGIDVVANTDYKLSSIITHGVAAGNLDYGATSFTAAAVVGANVDLVLSRAFYNGSGSTVTVKEMGIYAKGKDDVVTARIICICRDVIASVDILDTETASAQYTFRTTA